MFPSKISPNLAPRPLRTPEVHIHIEDDADATRISAVLEALGYEVVRALAEGDGPARLRWAVDRLGRRHRLTARERDVLTGVLEGFDNRGLAQHLEISRATVKWHLHNVFAKVGVRSRESLLRAALQLGPPNLGPENPGPAPDPHPDPDPHWAGPQDITRKIE